MTHTPADVLLLDDTTADMSYTTQSKHQLNVIIYYNLISYTYYVIIQKRILMLYDLDVYEQDKVDLRVCKIHIIIITKTK